ncbi:helix-turn-helix transcriptional regulator [Rhodococcus erythropolis]|uniref:helix-turn-helix domain-containing protein n=1 Tax=Rhodococcus erythropolis TaxID=1833 RepID=UPI002948D3E0|nr:helix-turn-helix transcriptional regulator [Rhodococcus erythropolis]MDV6276372.1 helix-turn-helix transcriptional regulator [Rhodococcus erythropolis]
MKTVEDVFVARMIVLRDMKNVTQVELAKRLTGLGKNFYDSTIAKIEKGQRRVSLIEAALISEALGVDLAYMTASDIPDDIRVHMESEVRALKRWKEGL